MGDDGRCVMIAISVRGETGKNSADGESRRGVTRRDSGRGGSLRKLSDGALLRRLEKLARVKSLLSTKYPTGTDFQTIFDFLLQEHLDRHDPERKISKRNARKERKNKKIEKSENEHNPCEVNIKSNRGANAPREVKERTRHIPRSVRGAVFKRDGGRCTFVGGDGTRCKSDWNLEIDHSIPYARGGDTTPDNLRLLCTAHNRLAAELEFGKEHMGKLYRRE
jgi:hypothetical protein